MKFKIQILNMGRASVQVKILKRITGNQQHKQLKMSQKMRLRVGLTPKPSEGKKDYEAIFRKFISIGEDGEEDYDMIDMQIEAQRAVRRITDHQEIVKQYQKVVRAYNRRGMWFGHVEHMGEGQEKNKEWENF